MLYVTSLSAVILGVLSVMLSLKVVGIRRKEKISVGDGGNVSLLRAMRAQANLLEYAPIGLILLACAEVNGAPRILLGLVAIAFVAGRLLHPAGIRDESSSFKARVMGMQLTLISLLALCAINILWLGWLLIT